MNPSLSQTFKAAMANLPFVADPLPGVGGVLKAAPEHFKVEEMLPYAPSGKGEHLFVKLRRSGWNTADVARRLAEPFDLKHHDIGWGGRKDKNAVTTQTFSLRLPLSLPLEQIKKSLKGMPFEILDLKRHGNKLKVGHVAGNRFDIILSQVESEALAKAHTIGELLRQTGVPNYYGEQRFGHQMRNLDRAAQLVETARNARRRQDNFTISVLQSALYNLWLKSRIERGDFNRLIRGDVARKTDTGGLFVVDDLEEASQRFERRKIIYTGPVYGHKMMAATHDAGDYETEILSAVGFDLQAFKPLRAPGSRRAALLYLHDLVIQSDPKGLRYTFSLPSGAYATSVMREFIR